MADGGFPNRDRANRALTIYGAAMCPYVASAIEKRRGATRLRFQLLSDGFRKNNPNGYDRRKEALDGGTPARDLVDSADVPFLVQDNSDVFPNLSSSDLRQMHRIRILRNEEIQHPADSSRDCEPEAADEIIRLCGLVLERCGLTAAAENVRRPSPGVPAGAPAVAEEELRKERARREWYKARFAGKSHNELEPWQQQKLADIEFEEYYGRQELVRREREEMSAFGDDIDGLRRWFGDVAERQERHTSEYAALIRRERERRDRERTKIAAFGHDIDGLRAWFDAVKERKERHTSEHATLLRREQERREQKAQKAAAQKRRERECQECEQAQIAAIGGEINRLRRWFEEDPNRKMRHSAAYATLTRGERAQQQQGKRKQVQSFAREQAEIHNRREDTTALRHWFDEDPSRKMRHYVSYMRLVDGDKQEAALQERERAEIAVFGDDIDGLRRWLRADTGRQKRHAAEHTMLLQQEQKTRAAAERERGQRAREQQEQGRRKRGLRERARAVIAALGDNVGGLRRWLDTVKVRRNNYPPEYAALLEQEREHLEQKARETAELERESAEIERLGDNIGDLRQWFNTDLDRARRHPLEFADLRRRELRREDR